MAILAKLQPVEFGTPNSDGADDYLKQIEKLAANDQLNNGRFSVTLAWAHTTAKGITGSGDVASGSSAAFRTLDNQDFYLPKNAQVVGGRYKVLTTLTSATDAATPGLSIPTDDADGIKAAIAISNGADAWDATAKWQAIIQVNSAATDSEVTTAERQVVLSNAGGESVTAGFVLLNLDIVVDALAA